MYKIKILNNCTDDLFEQLKKLIKKFAIDVFVVQKFNLANESYHKKVKYINNYKKYLSADELTLLKKDIDERIEFAIKSIHLKNTVKQTRYYVLLKDNKVIAFQTAQVRIENNIIEGWRNFAYTDNEYKGKTSEVIDTYGNSQKGILSNLLYENITKWFAKQNVVVEKTATGKNMYKNIKVYIVKKGFIPEKCDDKRVLLIKYYDRNISKLKLKQIYSKYIFEINKNSLKNNERRC